MTNDNVILPKFYRNFAWIFLGLALFIFIFILYLVWAKVVIIITPNQKQVSQELIVEVKDVAVVPALPDQSFVAGKIFVVETEGSDKFTATGSKTVVESDTIGEVEIVNTYSKDQTLVATTRISDPKDLNTVLVRLKKTVTVPAGGRIKVPIYADKPDQFKGLPDGQLFFPGLWEGLRTKIYAQKVTTAGNGQFGIAVVTAADLTQAQQSLKEKLFNQAITDANQHLDAKQTLWPKLVSAETSDITYDAKAGDEVSEFSAAMKLKAVVIVFDESQMLDLLKEKLKAGLAGENQVIAINQKNLSYLVDRYDLSQKIAYIKVKVDVGLIIGTNSQLLNKDNLTGKTAEEIQAYFSQYPEVKSVEVKFSPSWLKKTPRIQEKIKIQIGE